MLGLQLQVFNATFKSKDEKNKGIEKCKYAFLAEEGWFDSKITNPSYQVPHLKYVPVALEWIVPNLTRMSSTETDRWKADWFPTNYNATYYLCLRGYEGNPYLNTGCQGKLQLPTALIFPTDSFFHSICFIVTKIFQNYFQFAFYSESAMIIIFSIFISW